MNPTAEKLRDTGQSVVIAADEMEANAGAYLKGAIQDLIDAGREFSADDVRAAVDDLRPVRRAMANHPNLLPAIMAGFAKKNLIERVGVCRPSRASRRTNWNMVWRATSSVRGEAA